MNINNFDTMKIKSNGFYIGIDSGGTKCELLISAEDKKFLFNKSYKGVHYSLSGPEVYSNAITEFIKDSLQITNLKLKDCLGVCFGVAGAREDNDRMKLSDSFKKKLEFNNVIVTTDAMTALYGAFEGNDGIILISGTGSVLYGYSGGIIVRIGGWGRIIGDEGSGYWIGKTALNFIAKEFDESKINQQSSLLSKKIFEKFGINNLNINEKVFNENFEIQKIAPLVIECAEQKCQLSIQIIDEAVGWLLYHINKYFKVSKRKKPIQIAFIGSVVENRNILSDKLKNEIEKLELLELVTKKHASTFGAILIASEAFELTGKL